jgi:beta-galactosidase
MGWSVRALAGGALVWAVLAAGWPAPVVAQSRAPGGSHTFALGRGVFLLDGAPFQIRAGAIHYARVPRAYWRDRLRMARAMGLNAVTTYVFWNLQEPDSGQFDFSGRVDIAAFIRLAQQEGLWVILRPGPYVCAEWDFGGYPWWLLRDSGVTVRSRSPAFLRLAGDYLRHLGQVLAPLQVTHGGPILMVQVENEYGSYGADTTYMAAIRDLLRHAGFDVPLFTADGATQMPAGHVAGALPAVNGATDSTIFEAVRRFAPSGPFFVPELYPGWLDHWGEAHQRVPAGRVAHELNWVLAHGVSFSLYMFHGGTNFGFMNGANYGRHYQPQPTSYDYDAPLDEAGRPTPKFFALRRVITHYLPRGDTLPPVPATTPIIGIPRFQLDQAASLWTLLGAGTPSPVPLPMEELGQGYGYIVYRTKLAAGHGTLQVGGLRDYAVIFLDGARVGTLDRRLKQRSLELAVPSGGATLDVLVENGGRINYGPLIPDNRQGIVGSVTFRGALVTGWREFTLPMTDPDHARFRPGAPARAGTPALYRGAFTLTRIGDTFLDLRGWGKGAVWVNGHNLGRYWGIGPQQTLYLPGVWLRRGRNEIVVLDLDTPSVHSIAGLTAPILDQLEPPSR